MSLNLPVLYGVAAVAISGIAITLNTSGRAHDDAFTSAPESFISDQGELRTEIRAYLLDNPEVIMEAVEILQTRDAEQAAQSAQNAIAENASQLYESPNDLVLGNPNGDITMVEFSDYRCGYCKKAHPEVHKLLETDGNIKLIVKEFPILGEASVLAARFAIATKLLAGDETYARLNDALMTTNGNVTEGSLRRLVRGLEINADDVFAAMNDDEVTQVIAQNHGLGQTLGISGTPAFIIEGEIIGGYMPYDSMVDLIAELRS